MTAADVPAVVRIADVFPDAVVVAAGDIRPGDYVHDAFGRPSRVTHVRVLVRDRVKVTSGLWPAIWPADMPVTIRRGAAT